MNNMSALPQNIALDRRWDLHCTDVAEEFDWKCEMWARGIPFDETMEKGSGKLLRLQRKLCLVDLTAARGLPVWNKIRQCALL